MTRARRVVCVGLLGVLAACAENAQSARVSLFRELEARAAALGAERVAEADLGQYHAEKARAEALPPDAPERGDAESTARAYLEAAIARAEQRQLADERLALETRVLARETELTRVDAARLTRARELGLARTREITAEELARAYARLDARPAQRPKLSRDELATLTKALLTRAELIAFALDDADVDPAERDDARKAIAAAKASRGPEDAFAAADRALTRVLVLLAKLRTQRGPNAAEKASLTAELEAAHFALTRNELGLTVALDSAAHARDVSELCRIARAHPHGNVVALTAHKADADKLLAPWRSAGCDGARLSVRGDDDAPHTPPSITTHASTRVVFPAY